MEVPVIITEEMRAYFKATYDSGNIGSLETILIELKEKGCTQMQSLFLLIEQLQMSFTDANRLVLNSIAWNS